MRSLLRSALALALSLSIATPGFAYVFSSSTVPERTSRRSVQTSARTMNSIGARLSSESRRRRSAVADTTGRSALDRAVQRRRTNRRPKEGSDRYRILRPNTRSLRQRIEKGASLPPRLVTTGSAERPTRRAIWRAYELQ